MNKSLSFKILSVFTIRFLFVLVITTSNFKFDVLPLINDWKVYLLFIILWFLFEIFFNQDLQNHYLFIFFGIGFLKILLILYTKNFDLNIFYGAPDSIPLKDLGGTIVECFQYSRNCGGEPHFQRGPSYSILISIFTFGTKISPIFLIIIQTFLYAFINTGIIKKINSKNSIVNSSMMILLAVYPSLSIFSRIVLYEIWGVFCLFIAWYISDKNKNSKKNYYYYLLLISFSVYLQIQYFIAIFLFFIKFCYFNKASLKKILIGFLIPVLLIFAWGLRNATHLGHWDFNPYSGCYLEKNIIEPTEAIKNNISNEEIRNSSSTLSLLNDNIDISKLNKIEICEEFLKIIPIYYSENISYIFENYKNFSYRFFKDNLVCQYKEIGCEEGYWFFLINKIFNYLLIISFIYLALKPNKKELIDFLIFVILFLLILVLVTIDIPRMRIALDIYFFYLIGRVFNVLFKDIKINRL